MRVFCIDDDPIIRAYFQSRLKVEADMEVVGMAATGCEALEKLRDTEADVLLVDYVLPDMKGTEVVEQVRQYVGRYGMPKVLYCTGWADEDFEEMASGLGANGVLGKRDLTSELVPALRTVAKGGMWYHYEFAL